MFASVIADLVNATFIYSDTRTSPRARELGQANPATPSLTEGGGGTSMHVSARNERTD